MAMKTRAIIHQQLLAWLQSVYTYKRDWRWSSGRQSVDVWIWRGLSGCWLGMVPVHLVEVRILHTHSREATHCQPWSVQVPADCVWGGMRAQLNQKAQLRRLLKCLRLSRHTHRRADDVSSAGSYAHAVIGSLVLCRGRTAWDIWSQEWWLVHPLALIDWYISAVRLHLHVIPSLIMYVPAPSLGGRWRRPGQLTASLQSACLSFHTANIDNWLSWYWIRFIWFAYRS